MSKSADKQRDSRSWLICMPSWRPPIAFFVRKNYVIVGLQEGATVRTDAAEVLRAVLSAVGMVYVITHVEDDIGEATVRGALEAVGVVGSGHGQIPPHRCTSDLLLEQGCQCWPAFKPMRCRRAGLTLSPASGRASGLTLRDRDDAPNSGAGRCQQTSEPGAGNSLDLHSVE